MRGDAVLVSAHRCGAGEDRALENSRHALDEALALGVDYIEFDVQRCRDGALVVFHDEWVEEAGVTIPVSDVTLAELSTIVGGPVMSYTEVLDAIAGRSRAHLDLKFASPDAAYDTPELTWEVAVTRSAIERLGAENVIVTSHDDRGVRAVRDWADDEGLDLLVGLSLGRRVSGLPWHTQIRVRISELLPHLRYLESRANLVVSNHALARIGAARFARKHDLPLLVWTLDSRASLRHWLRPGRAWLVTTNHPERALELRDRASSRQPT